METKTHYQVEYVEKPVAPVAFRTFEIPSTKSQ
jgi:hypothetical protein